MVSNLASSVTVTTTPADNSQSKALVHTPFGDVMVDEQSQPDFYALFSPMAATAAASQPSSPTQQSAAPQVTDAANTPTLSSVFGSQPWMSNPGGTGPKGERWNYNPIYFATQATAEKVASMTGGTVIQQDDIITAGGGPFQQTAANELIQFADGRTVNAGLIANLFNHGYSQSYIDSQLQAIKDGDQV